MSETLKELAEDILLTAAKIRNDDYADDIYVEGEEDPSGPLSYRIAEVVVNLAERLVAITGIPPEAVWFPDMLHDMLDAEWGEQA